MSKVDHDKLYDRIKVKMRLKTMPKDFLYMYVSEPDVLLNSSMYFILTLFCLGWIVRIYV